jgi:parvulin-like peptidyl-prolyl isomerase
MNLRDFSFLATCFSLSIAPSRAALVDRVEAIVNKRAIFKSDLDRFKSLSPLRAKIDPLFANEPLAKKAKPLEEDIREFLIDEILITDKFPVSDAEVEQEINGIQGNLKVDREALKAAIGREGFKFEDYFKLMRISIAKRQLIDREIRNKAAVSDDDIRAEYNRAHSGSKTFRGAFHLYLIRVSKSNFKTALAAKEEALRAQESLKKGEAFPDVAKRVSDDPSQESGGDMGFLSYSEMSSVLQKEVQKLGPEKTSGVIEDPSSFMIVKVGEIKADNDSGLDKERELLRSRLMESEFRHQVRLWLDRERSVNFVKLNSKP